MGCWADVIFFVVAAIQFGIGALGMGAWFVWGGLPFGLVPE